MLFFGVPLLLVSLGVVVFSMGDRFVIDFLLGKKAWRYIQYLQNSTLIAASFDISCQYGFVPILHKNIGSRREGKH